MKKVDEIIAAIIEWLVKIAASAMLISIAFVMIKGACVLAGIMVA